MLLIIVLYKLFSIMYNIEMRRISISQGREKFADTIESVEVEPVIFERYGQDVAVLVSVKVYEQMLDALEEAEDIAAFDASLAETNPSIPWDEVRRELGW